MTPAKALAIMFGLAGVVVILAFTIILLVVVQGRDTSRDNQRHIDCIIALRNVVPPPGCKSTFEQLAKDGIYPAVTVPPPTTAAP